MQKLRSIPIRRSANRPSLFLGGDRELVMVTGIVTGALVFNAMAIKAAIFGAVLWVGAIYVLRLMAKSDPLMRKVYLRSLRYRAYYKPYSTPWRVNLRDYK